MYGPRKIQTKLCILNKLAFNYVPRIENKDKDNFTSLLLASAEGNVEAVRILLAAGADIFAQDKEDRTTLFWASAQNHGEVVKMMLEDPRGRLLLGIRMPQKIE